MDEKPDRVFHRVRTRFARNSFFVFMLTQCALCAFAASAQSSAFTTAPEGTFGPRARSTPIGSTKVIAMAQETASPEDTPSGVLVAQLKSAAESQLDSLQYKEAEDSSRRLLQLAKAEAVWAPLLPWVLALLSEALIGQDRASEARRLYTSENSSSEATKALTTRALRSQRLGRVNLSRELSDLARAVSEVSPQRSPRELGRANMSLGDSEMQLGHYEAAEAAYLAARTTFAKAEPPEKRLLAECEGQLGVLYVRAQALVKAASALKNATAIWEQLDTDSEDTAIARAAEARVLFDLAQFGDSLALAESALHYYDREPSVDPNTRSALLQLVANIKMRTGGAREADKLAESAYAAVKAKPLLQRMYPTYNYASHLVAAGRDDEAVKLLRQLLDTGGAALDPSLRISSLSMLAVVARRKADSHEALRLYKEALASIEDYRVAGRIRANLFCNLGTLQGHMGELKEAIISCERARDELRKASLQVNPDTYWILESLSILYAKIGQLEKAREAALSAKRSDEQLLNDLFSTLNEDQRTTYLNDSRPFELFAMLGDTDQLAESILRRKALVLDTTVEDRTRVGPRDSQSLVRRALAAKVDALLAAIPPQTAVIEYITWTEGPLEPKPVQRYGAMVFQHDARPIWVPLETAPVVDAAVNRFSRAIGDQLANKDLVGSLRDLSRQIWQPVQKHLPPDIEEIVISPDGWLNALSFAILLMPSTPGELESVPLIQKMRVTYVASARDLVGIPTTRPDARVKHFVGIADTMIWSTEEKDHTVVWPTITDKVSITLGDLATKPEVQGAENALKQNGWHVTSLFGKDAVESNLRKHADCTILHIASHGLVLPTGEDPRVPVTEYLAKTSALGAPRVRVRRPENSLPAMERSILLLGGSGRTLKRWASGPIQSSSDDGVLTAGELAALNLQNTALVVLSACDSGLGSVREREGVFGLRRAIAQAGAKNLIVSLWQADDAATGRMMKDFYERLAKGDPAANAWHAAQRLELATLRQDGLEDAIRKAGAFVFTRCHP